MVNITEEVRETLRNEGIISLVGKGFRFFKYKYLIYASSFKGGYRLSFDGVSARFSVSSIEELTTLRYISSEERDFLAEILEEVTPDDTVWDIGANIGVHTCILAQRAGKVVAVEPYSPNVRRLKHNLEINDLEAEVLPLAVSDTDGKETISIPEADSAGNQFPALVPDSISESRRQKLRNKSLEEIEVKKGDTLVEEGISAPDIIKIDVEGASHKVIKGLEEALDEGKCRAVFVEVHLPNLGESRPSVEDFDKKPGEIREMLEDLGFKVEIIQRREEDFSLKGVK